MNKTYRVVFQENAGSKAVDAIAATVEGTWSNSVCRFNGEHDLAFVHVPDENSQYLEALLDGDDNIISYQERSYD